MTLALALLAVAAGAALQRVTGIGFALVSAPLLVLLLDPFHGVLVANAAITMASTILFVQLRQAVDWRRFWMLLPAALIGTAPGAWLALRLPASTLDVIVGGAVIAGLTASFFAARLDALARPLPTAGFGFLSGLMNVTAGVGGPALSVYGVVTRWSQVSFAATLQPLFALMGATAVLAKLLGAEHVALQLPGWAWGAVAAAVLGGIAVGTWGSRHVSAAVARRAVIVLAYAGGLATLVRGIASAL